MAPRLLVPGIGRDYVLNTRCPATSFVKHAQVTEEVEKDPAVRHLLAHVNGKIGGWQMESGLTDDSVLPTIAVPADVSLAGFISSIFDHATYCVISAVIAAVCEQLCAGGWPSEVSPQLQKVPYYDSYLLSCQRCQECNI